MLLAENLDKVRKEDENFLVFFFGQESKVDLSLADQILLIEYPLLVVR